MRRVALLGLGGVLWLFLAALPTLADGGPHVAATNSGASTLTSDSCAGCHRAHTAQGELLLRAPTAEALCLTCHSAAGTGATADVESGIQYSLATSGTDVRGSTVLGALRAGGFVEARIDSAGPARLAYLSGSSVRLLAKVPVRTSGLPVTSAHLDLDGAGGVVSSGTAWGNISGTPGASFSSSTANPGGTMELTCTSCHNPHGNGQYRILSPIPGTGAGGTFVPATTPAVVTDAPLPSPGDERNYTVLQVRGTQGTDSTYLLYASQVQTAALAGSFNSIIGDYSSTGGDYFHRRVPWNSSTGTNDAPNGQPATGTFGGVARTAFDTEINAWCAQCHSRYLAITGTPFDTSSTDAIFTYRHSNTSNKPCTTCHVAHGSNAQMPGTYSSAVTYPGGTAAPVGDSRLLKIDNRGTCQACHDPTGTVTAGTYYGPTPTPGVP